MTKSKNEEGSNKLTAQYFAEFWPTKRREYLASILSLSKLKISGWNLHCLAKTFCQRIRGRNEG